jgi:DNA modification methylase
LQKINEIFLLIDYPRQGNYHLFCGDSIQQMKEFDKEYFDIICTSPPYGDNGSTVTYGQFSTLQLLWIDNSDFEYDMSCVENYSKIDSLSLGGALNSNNAFYFSPIITDYLSKISLHKQKKVLRFYNDYENAFRLMIRLLKKNGSMVLTLGNRHVDGIEFPFIEVNKELAEYYGVTLQYTITRNILNKRMPNRVSKLINGQSVDSISKETVLLFRKES